MAEEGGFVAQRLIDPDLLRGVVDVVVPADDVGDPHLGVIDNHREIVRRIAVGPLDDQVVQLFVVEGDVPFDQVVHDGHPHLGAEESHHRIRRSGQSPVATRPVVFRLPPFGERLLPFGLQFRRGASAVIGLPLVDQLLHHLPMDGHPLGLKVGALVPVQAKPGHRIEDGLCRFLRRADLIGILDPQDERPFMPPRVKPVEQGRPRAPDMEKTRWRRGKTRSYLIARHLHPFPSSETASQEPG